MVTEGINRHPRMAGFNNNPHAAKVNVPDSDLTQRYET
jgi:hypothetical protein